MTFADADNLSCHDKSAEQGRLNREAFALLVRGIVRDFGHAADGEGDDVALFASRGLKKLLDTRLSAFQLSIADHFVLSEYIDLAWEAADDRMPAHFSRCRLADGMAAAAAIVDRWRRPSHERDRRRHADAADLFARIEVLSNEFANITLEDSIEQRAAARETSRRKWREDTIAALAVLKAEHPAASCKRRAA